MLLSLSIIGIVLSAILLFFNARRIASSIYLGAFFFLVSLYCFIEYSVIYSKSVPLAAVIFINVGFLSYLTGPMLYLYFRSVLSDNAKLKRRDLWHLLPMLIFLFGTINYIFTPWSFKIEIATKLIEDSNFIGAFDHVYLYQIIPKHLVYLSRPVLILIYALASLVALVRFIRKKTETKVFSHQKYIVKWLMVLLGFLFILIISHIFLLKESFELKDSVPFFTLNFMQVLSLIGLTGLLISLFFFPGILYGLPQLPVPETSNRSKIKNHEAYRVYLPENKATFESEYLNSIQLKADACMKELQPYLHPDCNLAYLARLTKIPAHHFSFLFREIKNQSFNDYRNEWRIKHAKLLISEGRSSELSMEGIGMASGFSSRNTFYNAFRKNEGISPGLYAAKLKE
ncbi:MAG: helix-turn-helix transcriptional regulator [Bacteroidales bacterium]|nr:helix-turn-helix transcriptional regulator [Bacteroidales bacterium]